MTGTDTARATRPAAANISCHGALPVGVAEHRRDRGYLQTLTAPAKHLEWFEHFGHNPCYEEPDRFNTFITGTVLAEAPAGQKQRL